MRSALVCCKGYLVSRVRPPEFRGPLANFLSYRRAVDYGEQSQARKLNESDLA